MNAPLAELIAAIGTQLALRLVAERGGQRVYIPTESRLNDDCPLARIVGVTAAARLSKLWAGEWLTIPRAMAYMRRRRDREIRARYPAGETAAALAREFEISERQVYVIVAQADADEAAEAESARAPQLRLFG